jgi:hypothetical protein
MFYIVLAKTKNINKIRETAMEKILYCFSENKKRKQN